ncbi:hypothetical protein DFH06DRAFT_655153 [Mycena polygramma]|nr:hypothetical protein DFH06DRAFT_655153 [Mycena polygramma]
MGRLGRGEPHRPVVHSTAPRRDRPTSHQRRRDCLRGMGQDQSCPSPIGCTVASHHPPGSSRNSLFTRCQLKLTSDKLQKLIDAFFAVRPPMQDEWTSILFLNAMSGPKFKDARASLDTLLSAGSLTSAAVIMRIRHEQVRINTENTEAASQEASFAAFSKRYAEQSGSKPEFTNGQGPCANPQCKGFAKRYHDWDHCYGPGGRVKRPEQ